MTATTLPVDLQARTGRLLSAGAALLAVLGLAGAALGLRDGAVALWGFGGLCLLHLPMTLAAGRRLREGLGNRGLDLELRTLRICSRLLRLFAVGMALVAGRDLMVLRGPEASMPGQAFAATALLTLAALAWRKRALADPHPTRIQDARQTRSRLVPAGLLMLGSGAAAWAPWAASAAGLAMAGYAFGAAQLLAKSLAVPIRGCGGCGGSCG